MDAPDIARIYKIATRLILLVLLLDAHAAWCMASDLSSLKAVAIKAAVFGVEVVICVTVLVVGVEWGISYLLCWNRSAASTPLHFWKKLSFEPKRPETWAERGSRARRFSFFSSHSGRRTGTTPTTTPATTRPNTPTRSERRSVAAPRAPPDFVGGAGATESDGGSDLVAIRAQEDGHR